MPFDSAAGRLLTAIICCAGAGAAPALSQRVTYLHRESPSPPAGTFAVAVDPMFGIYTAEFRVGDRELSETTLRRLTNWGQEIWARRLAIRSRGTSAIAL